MPGIALGAAARNVAIAFIALLACGQPRDPGQGTDAVAVTRDTAALSQTDSLEYRLVQRDGRYTGRALVTFHNRTADTAFFVNCNGATSVQLQRNVDGVWIDSWTSEQDACLSAPIIVPPGDSLQRPVVLFDGYQGDPIALPTSPGEGPAIFRLVWTAIVHEYDPRAPREVSLPLPRRVSTRVMLGGAPH